ncbi:MAG: tyrosine-protein phosphatase [Acidimicrobiales bacterium]
MPQRKLPFEGARNFRDLGGYPVGHGMRTRWGVVYRSGSLHNLTSADLLEFEKLGVRAVFDLRSAAERSFAPDPVPSVHLPVQEALSGEGLVALLQAKSEAEAKEAMFRLYSETLQRRAGVFGQLLSALADPANLPAVVHCTAGKDRTGLAAALLLGALGVDRATVLADYELTGEAAADDARNFHRLLVTAGTAAAAVRAALGAPVEPLARALDELDDLYGGTEAYLLGPGGVEAATLSRLRKVMTEVAT